jgi:NAD(P) transhydrogenase subunit beta
MNIFVSLIIIVVLFAGIFLFKSPKSARLANIIAAFSMLLAIIYIFSYNNFEKEYLIIISIIVGSLFGYIAAIMVDMTLVPAMVAFQHGMGGIAAFIVAYIELTKTINTVQVFEYTAGIISIIVGAATFSASMIASLKLSGKIKQTPVILKLHNVLLCVILIIAIITGFNIINFSSTQLHTGIIFLIGISIIFGIFFSIRIGGADMPVLISFLNATAGLAAAFCGIILHNSLLIAFGATVAASGSVLTYVMCKAMNRSLLNIFIGYKIKNIKTSKKEEMTDGIEIEPANYESFEDRIKKAVNILKEANNVIIIPGYGMALAHAQFEVKQLADLLINLGKEVKFAIHPVAGRMPGHMNVLLAEAEVPYDKLYEMDAINDKFKEIDATVIVGACDVVNPAAVQTEGTPISGMPILNAHESKNVLILNFDEKPGYSGVENPLYKNKKCIKLFGDAKATLKKIIAFFNV